MFVGGKFVGRCATGEFNEEGILVGHCVVLNSPEPVTTDEDGRLIPPYVPEEGNLIPPYISFPCGERL